MNTSFSSPPAVAVMDIWMLTLFRLAVTQSVWSAATCLT